MKNIFWTGFCNKERIIAISEIENIVNAHGFLIDFKEFSDLSISMIIELDELKVNPLYLALKNYLNLKDFEPVDPSISGEQSVFLNVTFSKGTGNLRIEPPAVPG